MKLKRNTKFGEVSTHHFKIGKRNMRKFDPNTRKSKKNFILMGSFWAKYMLFELKRYRGTIFHETEEGYKIWRVIEFSFQNWDKEIDKIWLELSKVSKTFILMSPFWAKYILSEQKRYRGIIFMKPKRDAKFREELTCYFKTGERNLTNFNLSTQKSQRFSL